MQCFGCRWALLHAQFGPFCLLLMWRDRCYDNAKIVFVSFFCFFFFCPRRVHSATIPTHLILFVFQNEHRPLWEDWGRTICARFPQRKWSSFASTPDCRATNTACAASEQPFAVAPSHICQKNKGLLLSFFFFGLNSSMVVKFSTIQLI